MKNIIFAFLLVLGIALPVFAEDAAVRQDIAAFSESIEKQSDLQAIKTTIDQYEKKYKDDLYALTLVRIARNNIFKDSMQKSAVLAELVKLDTQWEQYAEGKTLTDDEYRAWATVKNQQLRLRDLLSFRTVLRQSGLVREYLQKAIKMNEKNVQAYVVLGQWSLYAPRIAGGGSDKAVKLLEKGASVSATDYDRYSANVWLSQAYFKEKETAKYNAAISAAARVYGETGFLKRVRQANKEGMIFDERKK